MKKGLVLCVVTFSLSGVAGAQKLFDYTIKLSPQVKDGQIFLFYQGTKAQMEKYSCSGDAKKKWITNVLKCRIPAGNYKLNVISVEDSFKSIFDMPIKVTGSATKTIPLKLTPKPTIPVEAARAFKWVVIKAVGEVEECGELVPDPSEVCASFPVDMDLLKRWFSLAPDMEQTSPWNSYGLERSVIAGFRVAGKSYSVQIVSRSDGTTWAAIRIGAFFE